MYFHRRLHPTTQCPNHLNLETGDLESVWWLRITCWDYICWRVLALSVRITNYSNVISVRAIGIIWRKLGVYLRVFSLTQFLVLSRKKISLALLSSAYVCMINMYVFPENSPNITAPNTENISCLREVCVDRRPETGRNPSPVVMLRLWLRGLSCQWPGLPTPCPHCPAWPWSPWPRVCWPRRPSPSPRSACLHLASAGIK